MDALAFVRDLAIILLALESLIIGILLVVLTFEVMSLVKLLREQIKPMKTTVAISRCDQRRSELETDCSAPSCLSCDHPDLKF